MNIKIIRNLQFVMTLMKNIWETTKLSLYFLIDPCTTHCFPFSWIVYSCVLQPFHINSNFLILFGIYSIHELIAVTLNAVNTHSTAIQPKSHEQKWDPSGLGIHNPPNGQRLSSHSNSRENCSSPDPSKPSEQS